MSIFLHFRDIAGYLSKVADFHTPTCIRLPRRGWPRSNFAEIFGVSKLNAGLSCGVVFVILCLAFLVELRLVTERYRQTDTQTQGHSIYRASIALRCKKNYLDFTEARDSEWQWHQLGHMQFFTSLKTVNHESTPPLSFLQAVCPSCRPTNSVKALKAT